MSFYVKIAGAAVLLICAFGMGRAYAAYTDRAVGEYEAFLSMLGHIRNKISCFLTTPCELLRDFENSVLERNGFLSEVKSGKKLSEAYEKTAPALAVSKEAKKVLSSFFKELGMGYKDEEISKIVGAERELSEILARERAEIPKNVKMAKTLLVATALGIIIMMI